MDERVRELERRFRETRARADEVAWLRERVRSGDDAPTRIYFPGNPWPAGHRVEHIDWHAEVSPSGGVRFHLTLETADYDEGAKGVRGAGGGDWHAPIVWNNYHRCTISSNQGFVVATESAPLDLAALAGREFHVDPLPEGAASAAGLDRDALGFHVYLLGHDTVADHRIRFEAREDARTFWLSWSGRIALTYAGHDELEHRFELPLERVRFGGIAVAHVGDERARRALLARHVVGGDDFVIEDVAGAQRFVPR